MVLKKVYEKVDSYCAELEKENQRLQEENEALAVAYSDAQKEIRALKNRLISRGRANAQSTTRI